MTERVPFHSVMSIAWEDHWQEIQTNELNRKNLGFLVQLGLESQSKSSRVPEKLVQDFYKAFFPNRESSS